MIPTRHGEVSFNYEPPATQATLTVEKYLPADHGWTKSYFVYSNGIAVCAKCDQFQKLRGRKVALAKALRESGLTRQERREVWEDVWKSGMKR